MKTTISSIIIIAAFAIAADCNAQKGDKKEKQLKDTQKSEQQRSLGGQRTENELKDDKNNIPPNQDNASQKSAMATGDTTTNAGGREGASGEVVQRNESQPKSTSTINTPAVIQRTSSESGSPAVIAQDKGQGRDGTNTVQRAKPNIAGAKEPGNMNLHKKNVSERNKNIGNKDVRRQEEIPQTEISKKEQAQNQKQVSEQRKQDKQSGEDYLKSDQGSKQSQDKQTRKERRKERRKKDKDSGK
jgi:hypothetical protein